MPPALTDRVFPVAGKTPDSYTFITQQLPPWLIDAHARHIGALKALTPTIPHNLSIPAARAPLKQALAEQWAAQNAVDKQLAHLSDLRAFAEPLLKEALRDYGEIEVAQTSIRLYSPANLPWWTINAAPGVTSRTVTLLDAALHNFSSSETFADFAFLSAANSQGQQRTLTLTHAVTGQALTAETFKALCRTLDIGARYQQQLRTTFGLDNPQVAERLRVTLVNQQKAALNSAAHLALANRHISDETYALVQSMLAGRPNLRWNGQPVDFYTLNILDTRVIGPWIIAPRQPDPPSPLQTVIESLAGHTAAVVKILVYIPEDPDHPLKEYDSSAAFVKELILQLRSPEPGASRPSYQPFFSQFIEHEQRGRFFGQLNNLLQTVRWHPSQPGDSRPNWRETPVETPNLRVSVLATRNDTANRAAVPASDDLWNYLCRVKLNKIINDARQIAVSTAYADRMARWEWWDNLEKMLSDLFNAALLVITPVVPVLGELMLAYTAYQLLDDTFEGIVDWAEGRQLEGWQHIIGVAENVIQLGIFHAGGQLSQVAETKLSPFIAGLQPVQTASGENRLWHPDLTPYQHRNLSLPSDFPPEENGLYHHRGKKIARQGNRHYEIVQDPLSQRFHLAHPTRVDAYRPSVALNGTGACVLEGEQPRAWSNQTLMRRLGPQTEGLSAGELEQIRIISDVEFGALRHMYVNNQPTPPLLADTLKRFKNDKQIKTSVESLRMNQPLDPASYWFEQMVTELEGWPADKALLVYQQSDLSGTPRRYGSPTAQGSDTLSLSIADVMSGRLPEKVVMFLDEHQLTALLADMVPEPERAQALRERLAEHIEQQSESLRLHLYSAQEASGDPHVQLLRSEYPDIPLNIAQRLLEHTRRRHLKVMDEDRRVPLEVKNQAEELGFEVTSTRVFEQIHQDCPLSVDAETLALNSLRMHTDALDRLRIEIRDRTPTGNLRTHVGSLDAPNIRILVRNKKAQYRIVNAQGRQLHGPTDFYTAVFHTLTTDKHFIDGERFRSWLIEKNKAAAQRRLILAEPPIRPQAQRETLILLGGGNFLSTLRRLSHADTSTVALQDRIKRWLPEMSEQGVRDFAHQAQSEDGLALLVRLETEGQTLETTLDRYVRSSTRWPRRSRLEAVEREHRGNFAHTLMEAWREGSTRLHDKFGQRHRGVQLDLSEIPWPEKIPELPADLRQVTHLIINGVDFTPERARFLQHFPHLRSLDLGGNALTALPAALSHMSLLRELNLAHNKIVLDGPALAHLRGLKRLRLLSLEHNPLDAVPDVSLMPDLDMLLLNHTHIQEWPAGLFAQSRPETFILELQGTSITDVPDVAVDSETATMIALTRLDRTSLSLEAQNRLEAYRIAAGLDPHRSYEPLGKSDFWVEDLDDENRDKYRTLWDALEHEHDSQGFFEVIRALEPPEFFEDSSDEALYTHNNAQMRSQLRTMLSAMYGDADLRKKLFRMSSFPGLCPDAGLQIFTNMGIEVEANQAQYFSRTPAERETRMVKLARGAANLKLLNHVARSDIAHRLKPVEQGGLGLRLTSQVVDGQPGTVDEVEVHLAYQTRLAGRLGLPWVSEHMLYRATAEVSEASITQAYTAVLALSEGDGLVDQMLLEPYWERFLKEQYATDYEANQMSIEKQLALLDKLRDELHAYAHSTELTDEQRAQKQQALQEWVQQLLVEDRVPLDEAMSDELYGQLLSDVSERSKEWSREQTHQLLRRSAE